MTVASWREAAISKSHNRKAFDCGAMSPQIASALRAVKGVVQVELV